MNCYTCIKAVDHGGDCKLGLVNNCLYYETDPRGKLNKMHRECCMLLTLGQEIPKVNDVLPVDMPVEGDKVEPKLITNISIKGVSWERNNKGNLIGINIDYCCWSFENYSDEEAIKGMKKYYGLKDEPSKFERFKVIDGGKHCV